MKTSVLALCAALGVAATASTAAAQDCGSPVIASMSWQSAELLSNVDKFILDNGFGCSAEIIVGDTAPTITSMVERGQPDIAPEASIELSPDLYERGIAEGRIIGIGQPLAEGGLQGWYIPKYIVEANPEIKTIFDALKRPDLFPDPEDPSKGGIHGGAEGWGAVTISGQYFKAYEAEKAGFRIVPTGSAAAHDGTIIRAFEKKQGWLGYYFEPTSLLATHEMVKLSAGVPHDAAEWKRCNGNAECSDPKPNEWPVDHRVTLVSKKFADATQPEVLDYLGKRAWTNAVVGAAMAWMTENQADGADGAVHFLKENKDLWKTWVSPEVAAKVEAAL